MVTLFFILALTLPLVAQQNHTITQIVETVRPAIVMVKMTEGGYVSYQGKTYGSPQGGPLLTGGSGTGFIVNPDGYILTAGHCAEFKSDEELSKVLISMFIQVYIFPQKTQELGRQLTDEDKQKIFQEVAREAKAQNFTRSEECWTRNFKKYPAEVLVLSPWYGSKPGCKDVAVLKIPATNLPAAPLGNSDDIQVGDELYLLGYPGLVSDVAEGGFKQEELFNPTLTKGVVSARQVSIQGVTLIQTDGTSMCGNSGGPAFTSSGKVVGICSFGPKGVEKGSLGYMYYVPINEGLVFVRQAGFTPHGSITDTLWHEALSLFWKKDYKHSMQKTKALLDLLPDHPDAKDLQTKLVIGIERTKGKFPLGLVIGIVLGIIIIGAAVVVIPRMVKSKPKAQAAGAGYLVVETGPSAGKRFELKKETKIGRDANASQIVLSDNVVSRQHAVITPAPEGTKIRHLSTTNPTLVNGQAITETTLKDGDRIKIGSTVFVYKTQ